jgi:leucyl aminopeptidase
MRFDFNEGDPLEARTDALILPVGSGDGSPSWTPLAEASNAKLSGELASLAADARFSGRVESTLVVPTIGVLPTRRIVLTGIGRRERFDADILTRATGAAVRAARTHGAKRITIALPESDWGLSPTVAIEAVTTGADLALYQFEAYRGKGTANGAEKSVESIAVFASGVKSDEASHAIRRGEAIARAVKLARDLVNEPASALNPEQFAARAEDVAESSGLEIEVLGPDELSAIGANAILAVGGGSANSPRLIRLRYQPQSSAAGDTVTGLVGKAITFDTGGYSIKTFEGMLEMKGDMAGGAAVLGAMSALRELACPTPVVATICAAENMISGTAFRPGDVIKGMNGVTMEILSTDAEGRLVLADGLVDTARRGATELIDLATLTGAAVVALGEGTTALFASNDQLADKLLQAADEVGEQMWRMPLTEGLESKIKGDVADIKNTGGRTGGAITAALFLQHFTDGLPWAHLDIAGSARQDKSGALGPKGASGVGVRTLLRYLTS